MNKTVLITGTSSGFGRETAKLLQQKGWNVAATMRSPYSLPCGAGAYRLFLKMNDHGKQVYRY